MFAILVILGVFVVMLLLTRVRVHLSIALLLGGITLNLCAGAGLGETVLRFGRGCIRADVWLLVAITALVLEFGRFLTEKENADQLFAVVAKLGGRHARTWSVMGVPALVGFVPMPGGALFSAPLVQQATAGADMPPAWKAAVNYWFRHVWEYWWWLYPGVITAMFVFEGIGFWQFVGAQFPFTLVAFATGFLFLVRPHVGHLANVETPPGAITRRLLFAMLPIVVIVIVVLAVTPLLKLVLPEQLRPLSRMLAMLLGLILGLVFIAADEKQRLGEVCLFGTLFTSKTLGLLAIIFGVMVFKYLLETSGLVVDASREMHENQVNPVYVVAALPFLAGLITGVAVGFAGAALPLVAILLASPDSGLTPLATLALSYGFGYMGMMLSPVHLCLLVSKDYFEAPLLKVYARLLPCNLTVLAYSALVYLVLSRLGW